MAKLLSLSGIETGRLVEAEHVSQSIIAFSGLEAYDITVSGSVAINGITYPYEDADSGSVLMTDGAGNTSFQPVFTSASYISSSNVDGPYGMDSIESASWSQYAVNAAFATDANAAVFAISAQTADTATTASFALSASFVVQKGSEKFCFVNQTSVPVIHGLDSESVVVQSYEENPTTSKLELIIPDNVVIDSKHQVTVTFAVPTTGCITISGGGFLRSGSVEVAQTASMAARVQNSLINGIGINALDYDGSSEQIVSIDQNYTHPSSSYAITASHALNSTSVSSSYAVTASHAITASHALNSTSVSSSYAVTASHAITASYAITASHTEFADSSSYALTASYAVTSSHTEFADSSSYSVTASYAVSASHVEFADSSSYALTASYAITASHTEFADSSSYAVTASYAVSASHVEFADSSSYALTASYAISSSVEITKEISSSYADTASYAVSASHVEFADSSSYAVTASYAVSASHVEFADSASYSVTASHAISASYSVSASQAESSSYAISASHLIGLVKDAFSATFSAVTTFTVTHGLNTNDVIVQVYDTVTGGITRQFIPNIIQVIGANQVNLTFAVPTTGYVVVSAGGYLQSGSIQNAQTASYVIKVNNALSQGSGIEAFTFNGSAVAAVQLDTASAHFTTGVSASQAPTITALSSSASTAREDYFNAVSVSTTTNTITLTKGDGTTSVENLVSSSYAVTASYAISSSVEITKEVSSSYADTASYAISASHVEFADSASYAVTASYAVSASHVEFADSSSYAISSSHTEFADSSSYSVTASYALTASFLNNFSYDESVSSASPATFNIVHNLKSTFPIVASYNSTNQQVIPDTVEIINVNQVDVTFAGAFTGNIVVKK